MKTLIELKEPCSSRYAFKAEFEAGEQSTKQILSAFGAYYAGDRARISIEGRTTWTGPLDLGGDQLPFEKFLATIGETL